MALVKNVILNLASDPNFDFLDILPLLVSPFSDRPSNVSSAGYVKVKYGLDDLKTELRVD